MLSFSSSIFKIQFYQENQSIWVSFQSNYKIRIFIHQSKLLFIFQTFIFFKADSTDSSCLDETFWEKLELIPNDNLLIWSNSSTTIWRFSFGEVWLLTPLGRGFVTGFLATGTRPGRDTRDLKQFWRAH